MKIFKNRRNRSIISLLLVVALSCQLFVDYGVKAKAETADAVQEEVTDDLAGIVSEDIDMRTEYSKYFKCNDGSYVQITSTEPVHYKDGDDLLSESKRRLSGFIS